MPFFNRLFQVYLYLGNPNYVLYNFKYMKFNLKYRKLHIYYHLRKAISDSNEPSLNFKEQEKNIRFNSFENMIESRRSEAKRSIGVQVQSEGSSNDLYNYCKGIAPVNSMFHYKVNNNHYFLVEFAEDCSEILRKCAHSDMTGVIPSKSPFLWFKASKQGKKLSNLSQEELGGKELPLKYSVVPTQEEIYEWMDQACSLSDCMKILYEGSRIDELGIRLRLLTARQIEMALLGLFPNIAVLPFGSTVNGLGKSGCDLDLVLQHDYKYQADYFGTSSSRLVHHYKSGGNAGSSRQHVQRQMEVLADLIQLYLPGCNSVKRILQAKVPIVKFSHEVTGVECDLSMTNMTGVYMSEMLYIFGRLDPLARPLVFTIKQWAWATGLTNPTPGRWITNFIVTLLTLFYLQVINRLPSLDFLRAAADAKDKRITEEIDCTFIRDLNLIKWRQPLETNESQNLSELLKGFFDYYTRFDFASSGISLGSGKCLPKPDFSPLYIVNPLEPSANVSKNLSLEELERLKISLRDAAWSLETMDDDTKTYLQLVTKNANTREQPRKYVPNRMLSIKRLFRDR